jgi:hypothetical protein
MWTRLGRPWGCRNGVNCTDYPKLWMEAEMLQTGYPPETPWQSVAGRDVDVAAPGREFDAKRVTCG